MKHIRLIFITFSISLQMSAQNEPLRLWYTTPAKYFEESLPIGNGKMGALIYGGADKDSIYLNDITLWTGKPVDNMQNTNAYKSIADIRKALFSENYAKADSLQLKVQGPNSQFYQPLGMLRITDLNNGEQTDYNRQLDIDSAVAKVTYTRGGIHFTREYFASNPDKLIAIHLTADKPKAINCNIALTSPIPHRVFSTLGHQITMLGHATGDEKESIHFCTMLFVKTDSKNIISGDSTVTLKDADDATIYIVNETSFNGYDKHPVKEGAAYLANVTDDAWHLVNYTYEQFRQRHISDYRKIFGRMSLHLDNAKFNDTHTTEEMLKGYSDGKTDHYLEELYFQYGRYLLISCSRTPSVPANLQGLWAPDVWSPWRGNYTVNINFEENYWPADVANMPEVVTPLFGFIKALSETGTYTARHYYGINEGWCSSHNSDIWAMSNPVGENRESPQWANWNMGGAWLVNTLWEHYEFTKDLHFLKDTAFPLMKGATEFCLQWLMDNPKHPGELITAPSTSPENEYITGNGYRGTTCYGGTADLAIIRELLTNTKKAAEVLKSEMNGTQNASQNGSGDNAAIIRKIDATLSKLHPYEIGQQGNLQEWYYDWRDQDPKHRHQSHLIGLYPGHGITKSNTPELADACARTLDIKGDKTTGWSTGWRMNLWARLRDGNRAYRILQNLLTYVTPEKYTGTDKRQGGGTYANLFDAHPPFQIDGNFGGTAGMCEMLIQSDDSTIELLPALPDAWQSGEVKGLCARGGFVVDIKWKDGKVAQATVTGKENATITVKYNGTSKVLKLRAGKSKTIK